MFDYLQAKSPNYLFNQLIVLEETATVQKIETLPKPIQAGYVCVCESEGENERLRQTETDTGQRYIPSDVLRGSLCFFFWGGGTSHLR